MARTKSGSSASSVKIKSTGKTAAPKQTDAKAFVPKKGGQSMAARAASTSYSTLLKYTNGGRGTYTGGK